MLAKLKTDFDEIIELVNKTPPALQETAFKMILEQWFLANTAPKEKPHKNDPPDTPGSQGVPDAVKPFLTANGITTEILEKVFHPTGPGAQLLASTLPGNGKAKGALDLRNGCSHPTGYQPDPVKLQAYYADIAQLVLLNPKLA
jgi:hypothetical protein